ncbi:probable G-protein coupled receptor CG31760 [Anoplophora glabripennis]|uniref:probable G-protein coupled receptor CG31760 n=1 Tax=Anoplophora glabripennis TaxID=217634 RepID=UPI0008748B3C|nr:probable G-protein coupled receptor CG31760 [Anoplophora glabripennis]
MFHKQTLINVILILLLLHFVSGNVVGIRHRRSRLVRARRHGNHFANIKKFSSDFENVGNIDWRTTQGPLPDDNLTITTVDEKIIVKLPPKPNRPQSNNSWQHIDKTVLYMGDRILDDTDSRAKDRTASETMQKAGDTGDTTGSNDMEQGRSPEKSETVRSGHVDIVTRFLRIVESQHLLGENCTAGTDLNLGEGVVDRYAQERFRVEADVAVNRANMLTRLWKYADRNVVASDYLLSALVFSMVEFNDVIFAAGNCYDKHQYKDHLLFCPYAYRLPEGGILVKDLAVEYNYLGNTSEWFFIARKNAENVIENRNQFSTGYKSYKYNNTAHDKRVPEKILSVRYEDGKWSKPYYDCGGGNIWMLTYTVPFFGFVNNTYFFKGTSGIDIDLRRVDIDQCPLPKGGTQLNIFAASDKCKKTTTVSKCVPIPGLGFRRGSYKCVCRPGFYFPDIKAERRYYNGTVIEEEYEKRMLGENSQYEMEGMFECLPCPEGCESCEDERPCVVSLNWVMRTVILILSCVIICCLPIVVFFTWKYGNVKVVRAASPVLLRVIALGAFFIYSTMIVMYPKPTIYTCTARVWLREIGFSLTYGALMLKTWRISVIFRVRSAKAVKITDTNLLKRLGVILTIFTAFLIIRTLVAPPVVIVGRTADDLKAYLCRTDWWDHLFTTLEVLFLVWGIRLCIVVRKAPSEFNESRFISMAIYNEFLLSVFLNISMLFLQKPANPDLMYIIFFCHTQLTVTLLLCLIFGSKVFMVFKNKGRSDEGSGMVSKTPSSKFMSKTRTENIHYSVNSAIGGQDFLYSKYNEQDVQEEFLRVYTQLEVLRERNMRMGNRHLASKIIAMQDAARTHDNVQAENSQNPIKSSSSLGVMADPSTDDVSPVKIKRQSVSFAAEPKANGETAGGAKETKETNIPEECASGSTYPSTEVKNKDGKNAGDSNGRYLMSGHARTHSIVINLDDKSRFTDEITV